MSELDNLEEWDRVEVIQDILIPEGMKQKGEIKKGTRGSVTKLSDSKSIVLVEFVTPFYVELFISRTLLRKVEMPEKTERFDSTDDKRVENNPGTKDYSGPDDVSLSYKTLTDENKEAMGSFKIDVQKLINRVRNELEGGTHPELELAIRHLIDGSAHITRYITRIRE